MPVAGAVLYTAIISAKIENKWNANNRVNAMEPSILRFTFFIGAEVLFMIFSIGSIFPIGLLITSSGKIKNSYASILNVESSVISTGFLILFSYILTGNSHYIPFMIILITTLVTVPMVEFFWLVFGSTNVPWFERTVWASLEFQRVNPVLNKLVGLMSLAVPIMFPVYVGMGYFGESLGNEDWSKYVVKAIIVYIGVSMLIFLPMSINLLISRNVMEGTRSRLLMP